MNREELTRRINAYLDANWDTMIRDIETLIRVPSVLDAEGAIQGAPFGSGPQRALSTALTMAANMGFCTHDADGYLGFADLPGKSATQIGIIGHVDVVPAGPGWNFDPFALTRKDGYLIGRGVIDDKGPSVMALHAMKFWKDQGTPLPYTLRFLFGSNEETGMGDVAYFHQHYDEPTFLITPDARFPVSYGEKGIYNAFLTSKQVTGRVVLKFDGGVTTNAVPGQAEAVVRANADNLPATNHIAVTSEGPDKARLSAQGKSAHASTPEKGENAIALIVDYLLVHNLCTPDERAFLELDKRLLDNFDGSGLNLQCRDEHFGALTIIGGTIALENDRFVQSLDCRFPTTLSSDAIDERLKCLIEHIGGSFKRTLLKEPFLMDPNSPLIQALLDAYNEATGEEAQPHTMAGGTYAREFTTAASFGAEMPWLENPAWVGGMHGPDEGVSESLLKQTFRIYTITIEKLMQLDLAVNRP